MNRTNLTSARVARGLAAAALVAAAGTALGGWPPSGVPSGVMPWELDKYRGYKEKPPASRPTPPPSPHRYPHPSPKQYTIQITVLPQKHTDPRTVAFLMVHLPIGADLWVDVQLVANNQKDVDSIETTPLEPGKTYTYHFRARWLENGQYVSQTHAVDIKAGQVVCVDVVPKDAESVAQAVAANVAKLDAADQPAAREQRSCAVQEGIPLGSMGTPVKLTLKGQAVFLCCKGCVAAAEKNPDQTLEKAKKLKEEKAPPK